MALNMKRVTDLQEKTEVLDEDLFAVGNNGTPSLRKTKWSTIWNKIVEKFRTTLLVQNATTADTTRAASAAVAKNLQDQITELNTKKADIEDVTEKFNWGTAAGYKALRIGKVVFFRATCTAKSHLPMNFVTITDPTLQPIEMTPIASYVDSGADFSAGRYAVAYVYQRNVTVRTLTGHTNMTGIALQGNVSVSGSWIIK